jgi:hypothetical protein
MSQKSSAGVGFLFCALVIVGLVLTHTRLWLFGEFAEGNHVAQDLHSAAAGVVGLVAYPPILSSTLSALGSLETPMIIVSAAPPVMALAICAILFWLLARSLTRPVGGAAGSG